MKFELPPLKYAADDLAPGLSAETLGFHHGKHHLAYVNNLNNLLPGSPFEEATLETMIRKAEGGIFNNAAQVWNHTFYFDAFSPSGKRVPSGTVAKAIEAEYGSFDAFREAFTKAATTLFGSGWAWLCMKPDGRLTITQEQNAGNPIRSGLVPIMTCDVWEHAYYIDYRNRRPDYIKSFWDLLDWKVIGERYDEALKK
ncbi:superoxide dismutase [bacterium]|jgi:Fe-Mn family superoxide dismutase|nr:superoxide dismutase [bacterium]